MCGRFALNQISDSILELLGFGLPESFQERFNIAPSENSWVALQEKDRKPVLQELYWGLIPFWAKEKSIGMSAINARTESVAEKPMFREAYQRRRCLVPASGFYEWRKNGKGKIPYYFSPKNEEEPLVFAGLWENWNNGNETLRSFTIITTAANDFMKPNAADSQAGVLAEVACPCHCFVRTRKNSGTSGRQWLSPKLGGRFIRE